MRKAACLAIAALAFAMPLAELLLQGREWLQLLLAVCIGAIGIGASMFKEILAQLRLEQIGAVLQLIEAVCEEAAAAQAAIVLEVVDAKLCLAQPP